MEEPMSGPEPEAPAEAAPGEPTEPGEHEGGGAVSSAGGLLSGLVGPGGAAELGDQGRRGANVDLGGQGRLGTTAEPGGQDRAGTAAEPEGQDRPGTTADPEGPAGPQPIGVGVTPTGEAAVDAGLRRLADADHLPASGHLQVYEDVHRGLRDVLAGLDQHPGPPAPSSTTHDNRS
ncbi:hypothetical protein [Streptomyces sp. Isolate_219]|uniref:hypothetical protein n=1 Tax=Streptomyces sp. Isolate_219 TaxID=2950110 RepID=UPI0021CA66D6|nr:hypothetical protein [Streptomyces sp. Isolate_219]MCR8577205.1 hypothetical protein [Streptomyces sp. Isolate_219]